jgi:hypothetical protein
MNLRFFSLILVTIACIALGRQAFGQAGNDNPGGVTSDFHGSITTAGYYDPYTGNAKREITDIVVAGSIGAYPLQYTRTLNTRGPGGWSNNYGWSLTMFDPYFNPGTCGPDIEYCESLGRVTYPNGGSSFELLEEPPPVYRGLWTRTAGTDPGISSLIVRRPGANALPALDLRSGEPTAARFFFKPRKRMRTHLGPTQSSILTDSKPR